MLGGPLHKLSVDYWVQGTVSAEYILQKQDVAVYRWCGEVMWGQRINIMLRGRIPLVFSLLRL